jgi:protein-tyrosine phosphatase
VGDSQGPQPTVSQRDHIHVILNDSAQPQDNRNLDLVAEQAVDMVRLLRAEGRDVFLHCSDGASRTPFIGALYGARLNGSSAAQVMADIRQVMPHADPNPLFARMVERYH